MTQVAMARPHCALRLHITANSRLPGLQFGNTAGSEARSALKIVRGAQRQRRLPGIGGPAALIPEDADRATRTLLGSPALSSSEVLADTGPASSIADEEAGSSSDGVKIDLQLPRRSLLVTFTCNSCNGRTERLVNPVAWHRGLVIAQCADCKVWHKLADAANLIDEVRYADLEE